MKEEISVAVRFLTSLIEVNNTSSAIGKEKLEAFNICLGEVLSEKFQNHWFPDKPSRGQAYRCIRVNGCDRRDQVIKQATDQCGLPYEQLHLPHELTIWIDPRDVSCRFGEHNGSFCTLATNKDGKWDVLLDSVNLGDIQKKSLEQKDKVTQEMSTRKNGRRCFLPNNNKSSPNFNKAPRNYTNGYTLSTPHHINPPPSPSTINWNHNHSALDMFSTSPPNQYSMYNLAKFSPPKYGYGTSSKWSTPITQSVYGPSVPPGKGDKYHWFNSGKATVKA